jgi:hypothetical protein
MANTRKWFHLTTHTYGVWLYGDPRGFRTRHHREHIEGDYKNPPPPGKYADKLQRSKESLKQDPVKLNAEFRAIVGATRAPDWLGRGGHRRGDVGHACPHSGEDARFQGNTARMDGVGEETRLVPRS